jgi:hypothetical protein
MPAMELNESDWLTALEVARLVNAPEPVHVVETISNENQYLMDLPVIPCNNGTKHTVLLEGNMPKAKPRNYYEGSPTVTSQTGTKEEETSMWRAFSQVDEDLARDSEKQKFDSLVIRQWGVFHYINAYYNFQQTYCKHFGINKIF